MKATIKFLKLLIFVTLLISTAYLASAAEELSELALYNRCYAQLTQFRANPTAQMTLDVISGKETATSACMKIFDRAQLTNAGTRMGNPADGVGRAVLNTLHNVHASWFQIKDFPENGNFVQNRDLKDLYDNSAPAAFLTKALFDPAGTARSIVTGNQNLRVVRTDNNPAQSLFRAGGRRITKADYMFGTNTRFASRGDILGVEPTGNLSWAYSTTRRRDSRVFTGTVQAGATRGGGFLGTPAYLLMTVEEVTNFRSNGGLLMPRKWARSAFHDSLCRDLPAVRELDITSFVVPTSSVDFRQTKVCTRCHASMDRAASVIRNFAYTALGSNAFSPPNGGLFPRFMASTAGAETGWPAEPDANYFRRPTNGTFYFRSYDGQLINLPINSVQQLGNRIADTPDFYVCLAKRYYRYFTGIDTDIGDLGDPDHGMMSEDDKVHRQVVIDLGLDLQKHQDLRLLLRDIIRSKHYRLSDFGVSDSKGVGL